MKKYNISLLLLLQAFGCLWAQGKFYPKSQDVDFGIFRVIASTEYSYYKYTIGRWLVKGDTLNIHKKKYMALLYRNGATIEINREGKYAVEALEKQLLEYQKKHPTKPVHLKIKNANGLSYHYNGYPTGSVSRHHYSPFRLNIHLTNSISVLQQQIPIYWRPVKRRGIKATYVITLNNDFGEAVLEKTIKDTMLMVELPKKSPSVKEDIYVLSVAARVGKYKNHSGPIMVGYLSKQHFLAGYRNFWQQNRKNKGVAAGFLEVYYWSDRECYLKADRVFQGILQKHPNNKVYRIAYEHFRMLNGLGDEPTHTIVKDD
ncbi:hypothetical protein BKI52_41050 [marine bacterium AO1-C]|nr:hypothetical protein BKI52_41050 [marine bacterium AO1-C]